MVVVERHVVVRLGPRRDALDRGVGNLEERGSGVIFAAFANLADEVLRANVLRGDLLEEAVLDRITERRSPNALAIGDGGVVPSWTRERIILRSASANTIIMFNII